MPSQASVQRAADRRNRIAAAIEEARTVTGFSPTHRELAVQFGVSTRTVGKDLDRLARDGRIQRIGGMARGVRVLGSPEMVAERVARSVALRAADDAEMARTHRSGRLS
jgi:DeoR/GlpR family transcriptional regulator of sugar metabolism